MVGNPYLSLNIHPVVSVKHVKIIPIVCGKDNGGCDPLTSCIDFFGGRNCSSCPTGYEGNGETKCLPICEKECENGGICSFPNTCDCQHTNGYGGKYCQLRKISLEKELI